MPALHSVSCAFWKLVAEGTPPSAAGLIVGVSDSTGPQWFSDAGELHVSGPRRRSAARQPLRNGATPRIAMDTGLEVYFCDPHSR
ncbi:hypothetical protein EGT67_15880 [Prescottella agglutinans]|uniref:Uncharacterized protein n=1 Tax=Prescottella agglutinans TaxID=1644129 RepID=A0A3S3E9I1_9NOCA|nr:hypothetical protein EGT67_15880 [Prescottella agglutinans]